LDDFGDLDRRLATCHPGQRLDLSVIETSRAKIAISQPQPLKIDEEMYKWRHLIENFFCKLQEFKRIAMRSDKTGSELHSNDLSCRRCLQFRMNLNRP
jgi:hypothetical protein